MDNEHFQNARQVFCNLKDNEVELATRHSLPGSHVIGVIGIRMTDLTLWIRPGRNN